MTETIELDRMTQSDRERVAAALWLGGLVCLPADTVYGLAGIPQPGAIEKIYRAKGREARKPLALVFAEVGRIEQVIPNIPNEIRTALPKLMPGPVTCILPLDASIPGMEFHSEDSVGVRVIPAPAGDIYKELPSPLAVTSANLSGRPDTCAVEEIPNAIAAACEFVVDGGRCELGVPSTIVDLRPLAEKCEPVILREGPLDKAELLRRLRFPV